MRIIDSIFGELEYNYIWSRNVIIDFLGKETKIVDFPIKDFSVKVDIVEFDNLSLVLNEINKVSHKVKE